MNVILTTLKTADLILKSSFTVLLDLEKYTRGWATTLSPNSVPKIGYSLSYSIQKEEGGNDNDYTWGDIIPLKTQYN